MFDIVLATYNGEKYLAEQLSSIFNSHDIEAIERVIVVDDGSVDDTLSIIAQFQTEYPCIELIVNPEQALGPAANFARGLELATAPWVMLCDQDDIWHPCKLQDFRRSIRNHRLNANDCNAVFSEVALIDANGKKLPKNYSRFKNIPPDWYQKFSNLIQQNSINGCALCVSQGLIKRAAPIPSDCYMHDWWLVLFASAFGQLVKIDWELVYYRQHRSNTFGARQRAGLKTLLKLRKEWRRFQHSVDAVIRQAESFYQRTAVENSSLHALVANDRTRLPTRLKKVAKADLYRSSARASLAYYAVLLTR